MKQENPLEIQSILTNAVNKIRQEQLKTSPQLTLGELILKLEAIKNPKLLVVFDIKKYHPIGVGSWRGAYNELALEYDDKTEPMILSNFLKILKNTIGKTLMGYKGGDFLMGKTTPVWVANYGECKGFRNHDTAVIDVIEQKSVVIIKTTKEIDY